MKKTLTLIIACLITAAGFSQSGQVNEKFGKMLKKHILQVPALEPAGSKIPTFHPPLIPQDPVTNPDAVTIIDIGQSVNANGLYGGPKTALWADNNINAIGFVHRMVADANYGGNRVAYDISKDGGVTWVNNIRVYEPTGPGTTYPMAAGRYPQGGIYNPAGNTNSANAYFSYFIPTIDGSNSTTWGGYGYGVHKLDSTQPYTQHNLSSHGAYHQNVPDAFTINKNGDTWVVDPCVIDGIASNYTDTLLISKGVFNTSSHDYEVTQSLMYYPVDKYIADAKVAFGPDGQTGYISLLTHDSYTFNPDSSFYPVLFKTTDGGNTWSDPIRVKLWGPDGIQAIKNFLSDSLLAAFYVPPIPARDSIPYTTAWEHDLVVDANGNPHICVDIGISGGAWNIYTPRGGYLSTFDIFSANGGNTWQAMWLDSLKTFDGQFGGTSGIVEYNRPNISRTMDGNFLFYSWLDTETEGLSDNVEPNIYCKGYSLQTDALTPTRNVTKFTLAYAQAFMGSQSHYVFNNANEFIVPFVYQEMNPSAPNDPVQYKYIHNLKFTPADFGVGINETVKPLNTVSQAYPNPAGDYVMLDVNLVRPEKISLEITDLLGRRSVIFSKKGFGTGSHSLKYSVHDLNPGLYMVTVTAGDEKFTRKMIVN